MPLTNTGGSEMDHALLHTTSVCNINDTTISDMNSAIKEASSKREALEKSLGECCFYLHYLESDYIVLMKELSNMLEWPNSCDNGISSVGLKRPRNIDNGNIRMNGDKGILDKANSCVRCASDSARTRKRNFVNNPLPFTIPIGHTSAATSSSILTDEKESSQTGDSMNIECESVISKAQALTIKRELSKDHNRYISLSYGPSLGLAEGHRLAHHIESREGIIVTQPLLEKSDSIFCHPMSC